MDDTAFYIWTVLRGQYFKLLANSCCYIHSFVGDLMNKSCKNKTKNNNHKQKFTVNKTA